MALNNIDAAAESLEKALQFEPNDGEFYLFGLLGLMYEYITHLNLLGEKSN